jgi:hypothetical protein
LRSSAIQSKDAEVTITTTISSKRASSSKRTGSSKYRYPSEIERAKHGVHKDGPLLAGHDDQVMTFHEWCRLNRISERTGRRILDSDDGPKVTWLSSHRIGITMRANRAWQNSRSR